MNAKLYIDGKEVDGFFPLPSASSVDKGKKFIFTNTNGTRSGEVADEDEDMFMMDDGCEDGGDETEVFLVAERPSLTQRRQSWLHRRLSSGSRKKKKHNFSSPESNHTMAFPAEVTILSVNSFCRHVEHDDEEGVDEGPMNQKNFTKCKRRQYSIPNLLLNASASRECVTLGRKHRLNSFNPSLHLEDLQTFNQIPRSRLVSLVAGRLQQRPVYAPCHPIDLEGLQETAV